MARRNVGATCQHEYPKTDLPASKGQFRQSTTSGDRDFEPPSRRPACCRPIRRRPKRRRETTRGVPMIGTLATTRRRFLEHLGMAGAALTSGSALADSTIEFPLPSGPRQRFITTAFPQKRAMILQRTRPPLLETP